MSKAKQATSVAQNQPSFIRKWGTMFVLSLALAIIIIDTTLLNVSLGPIIRDLKTDIISIQWVITAYSLTLAALTITGGRIGDLFGRKKLFMLGAVIFAIGSLIASLSHSVGMLLIGESIIEGIGAALMMPATASLLMANFSGRDRAIAFGLWGGIAGAASAIGPILGGWLTSAHGWRWGFRINVVVAALLVIGSIFFITESRDTAEKPSLDFGGVILSALGMLLVIFGVIESSSYGWWVAKDTFKIWGQPLNLFNMSVTPWSILVGVLFLIGFIFWERRVEGRGQTPLVSLDLFKNRQFSSGTVTLGIISLSLTGLIFSLPIFFQGVKGLDAFHTGLSLLPLSLSLFIMAPLSIIFTKWFTPKRLIQFGLLVVLIAIIVIRQAISPTAGVGDLAIGLMLFGVGMGFVQSNISNLTLSAVSVEQAGEASGVNSTGRQLGSSLGSAIIGAILLATLTSGIISGIKNSAVLPEMYKDKMVQAVSSQTANIEFSGGPQLGTKLPPTIITEIKNISNTATADAVKSAMLIAIGFAILSLLISQSLPNIHDVETSKPASGH